MSNVDWVEVIASGLSLIGLLLGFWGVVLVIFQGYKTFGGINRPRLVLGILIPWLKIGHRLLSFERGPFPSEDEVRGWGYIIWSFLLQAISILFRVYQYLFPG